MQFDSAVSFARHLVGVRVQAGDHVIDATAGNGHDSSFLAEIVGSDGSVLAFDVQESALVASRKRLEATGLADRVQWLHTGHEHMGDFASTGGVAAVMFNLGYLPHSDKSCITRAGTTIPALEGALGLLKPGGIVTLVCYTGHPGGAEEAEAVDALVRNLAQDEFEVLSYAFINLANHPPRLIAIAKREAG